MAIVWMDGFDLYPSSPGTIYPYTDASSLSTVSPGIFDIGKKLRASYTGGYITLGVNPASTYIVAAHYQIAGPDFANEYYLFKFYESNILHLSIKGVIVSNTIVFKAYRADNTLVATSSGFSYTTGSVYWISTKVTIHDTAGVVSIKVNGNEILNATGLDTRNGGTSGVISSIVIYLLKFGNIDSFIDNLHVMDTSGTSYNDHINEHKIFTEFPSADGALNDFTASSGSRYACVNETGYNDDTNYIYSSTSGHNQSFSTDNISGISTVAAVKVFARARKDDTETRNFKLLNRQGSTNYSSSSFTAGSSYTNFYNIWQTNPATSSNWTANEADTCEIGVSLD